MRVFRGDAREVWRRQELPLSLSLFLTHLLSKRCGSGCRGGTKTRVTPPPSRITIDWMTVERVESYLHVPLSVRPIHVEVTPFPVKESIPRESYIAEAVKRLHLNRSGGPSGMRAEHLRQWLS